MVWQIVRDEPPAPIERPHEEEVQESALSRMRRLAEQRAGAGVPIRTAWQQVIEEHPELYQGYLSDLSAGRPLI